MARQFDSRLDSQQRFDDQLDYAKNAVTVAVWIFGFFAIVHLQNYSLAGFVQILDEKTIIGLTLTAYYYAWVAAQPVEMKMSRTVYIVDPGIPKSMFFQIPVVIGAGVALFFLREDEQHLAEGMVVFFLVDVAAWKNVARLTYRYETPSAKVYQAEHSYVRLVQLRYYVRAYLRGGWQYIRYTILFCILVFLVAAAFAPSVRHFAAGQIHANVPQIMESKAYDVLFALLFFLYISVGEGFVWTMRLRTRRALLILNDLRLDYNMSLAPVR